MQKAIVWCLFGIVIGAGSYIIIDRIATPQPLGVAPATAPGGTQSSDAGSGQVQQSAQTPVSGGSTSPSTAMAAEQGAPGSRRDADSGFRTELFDDSATAVDPVAGQPLDTRPPTSALPRGMNAETREQISELRDIQAELRTMTSNPGSIDMGELDAVLQRLESVGASEGAGGMDLSALRANLDHAAQMMALSQRVQEAVADGATPEELAEHIQELEGLQMQARPGIPPAQR